MKEAIGHAPLYPFIMFFIVITFGFLIATLMYYKAYKVNSMIAYSIEEFEGFNSESIKEINKKLGSMGYRIGNNAKCKDRKNMTKLSTSGVKHPICIYESKLNKDRYFNYGIVTYIYFDVPVIGGTFEIPVYTESERMFRFSS